MLSDLLSDLRYAIRSFLRAPGFTIAAVLTLALGIGANTAIFSVVDAVLLRPLPYPKSDRLVMVWDQLLKFGLPRRSPEYHTADAYRHLDNIFESTGGIFWFDDTLLSDSGSEHVSVMDVSKEVFPMLAPRAALGRIFMPEEYRAGVQRVVMLGRSLFMRRFGGDPSMIGKSIRLGVTSYRVVGVMSSDFDFSVRSGDVDIWIPVPLETRRSWGNATRMIARLRPGVSLRTAQAALSIAAKHVDETEHPYSGPHGEDAGYGVKVVTLHDQLLGEFRTVTLILLCAVAAVLLIACVNVANLLLVRTLSREKETSIRRALGATGARLIAQWITESALLASLGGALGLIAAIWGVKLLVRLSPAALPDVAKIGIDGRALAFTTAISCLVCLAFGLAPAIASVRTTWGARGATRRSRGAASLLVTAEVTLAVMLMIGAGLLLKSFSRLTQVDPGFNAAHLLTMRTDFARNTSPMERVRFYTELRERLASLPGVISATTGALPLRGGGINAGSGDPFGVKGQAYDAATGPVTQFANLTSAGVDYFRTFQIPLRAGRVFSAKDSAGESPSVVIVNETLARAFFPQGAIGQQIGVPPPCRDTKCDFIWAPIVGVAADVKTRALDLPPLPQIYLPQPSGNIILRTAGDPLSMAHAAGSVIHSMDPAMTAFDVQTMDDRLSATIGQPRFETVIVAFFAGAALFLAAIGIFGVVAHSTVQRTQEIGIRMALGADGARVIQTVMFDGLRPVAVGLALGLVGALASSRILSSVLFHVAPTDVSSFLYAAVLLALVAVAACLSPARRATRVDPAVTLREN
jgi:putative ABC transport system permease protein